MFASRALTGSERNYQNLERECLATIWGMEKFHYFLYGKEFTLETDQKPLVLIYRKHMVEISPRIQRLIVRSFPYQPFDVQYRKGMEILLADALSRVTPTEISRQFHIEEDQGNDQTVVCYKSFTHFGTIEKIYPWKMD